MIPANETTLPEMAYSLAIEAAERFAKRYHRLAFWVPFYGKEFQIKAKMWEYTVQRLKKHAQYLGTGVKSKKSAAYPYALMGIGPGSQSHPDGLGGGPVDVSIPARPDHLFGVAD